MQRWGYYLTAKLDFHTEDLIHTISEKGVYNMNRDVETTTLLSKREKEVLRWLKEGKSSWEVAFILNISERTVNFHVNNIMLKLNAVSRTQAVAVAIEKGLAGTE
jgi:DNA-binding CsgD family transcriptional regulator